MQRRWSTFTAMLVIAVVPGFIACGGDDTGSDQEDIAAVIKRAVTTKDPKVECQQTVTADFVQRVYGDVAQCREAERPEPGDEDPTDARTSDVKVDGDSATAKVRFIGGDTDGARGTVELRKEGDEWRVDDLGVDLLRSVVETGLTSDAQDEPALRQPEVRSCARNAFAELSGGELKRVAYAAISEREGSDAELGELLTPCLAIAGSGEGSGGASFLREKFEEGIAESARKDGMSRSTIACINRRLRSAITDEQIAETATRRRPSAEINRSVASAIRACR